MQLINILVASESLKIVWGLTTKLEVPQLVMIFANIVLS
jgi:hypothetical protein